MNARPAYQSAIGDHGYRSVKRIRSFQRLSIRTRCAGAGTVALHDARCKRGDEWRIAHHHSSPHAELSAQPETLRSSARGNASRCSEWLLMGKLGVDLNRLLVAVQRLSLIDRADIRDALKRSFVVSASAPILAKTGCCQRARMPWRCSLCCSKLPRDDAKSGGEVPAAAACGRARFEVAAPPGRQNQATSNSNRRRPSCWVK